MDALELDQALERWLPRVLEALRGLPARDGLRLEKTEVQATLVDEEQIRTLNEKYRNKGNSTDVLSFPAPEVFRAEGQLGEVILCDEVLRRQAEAQQHSEELELLILLVHGCLHLVGFDHELGLEQEAKMLEQEEALLAQLVPPQWVEEYGREGLIRRSVDRCSED